MEENRRDALGLPPPPQLPRPRVSLSTLGLPTSFSQLGRQPQLLIGDCSDNIPFPKGSSRNIVLENQYGPQDAIEAKGHLPNPNMDDKRFKRLLSNRISAQRSRLKRASYITEMEDQVKELEAHIANLSPELVLIQRKQKLLQMENELMRQKKITAQEHINLKQAETNAHRSELYHLKQILEVQQQQKQAWMAGWGSEQVDCVANRGLYETWPVQNMYHPWLSQQFSNPNMNRLGVSQPTMTSGIPAFELHQMANSEANLPGKEQMEDQQDSD